MKRILTVLILVLASLQSFSQQDTSKVTITLLARHHAYIIAFMPDKGDVEKIRYINQVAQAIADTSQREQPVTVVVSESLITTMYKAIGSQQERLCAVYNEQIRQELLPQIMSRPSLIGAIQAISASNGADTENMIKYGFGFIQSLKQ